MLSAWSARTSTLTSTASDLRNRIAHHEPILERDIGADLAAIGRLIHARCPHTLGWLQRHERATTVLAASPLAVHR